MKQIRIKSIFKHIQDNDETDPDKIDNYHDSG